MTTKGNSSELSLLPTIATEIRAETGDMAAIAVTAIETQLQVRLADLRADLNSAGAAVNKALTALTKAGQKQVMEHVRNSKLYKEFTLQFRHFGIAASISVAFESVKADEKSTLVMLTLSLSDNTNKKYSSYTSSSDFTGSIPANSVVVKASKDLAARQKKVQQLSEEIITVRSALGNMDQYERRARAAIAVTNLKKTPAGEEYLREMLNNLQHIPAIKQLQLPAVL